MRIVVTGKNNEPKVLRRPLTSLLKLLPVLPVAVLPFLQPALAETTSTPADGPMLCQTFTDAYAAQQAKEAALPPLFRTPFDFATLDWMNLDVGKAVNVIKEADITEVPGVAGALFCMADGTIKQINACANLGGNVDKAALLDRFAGMAGAFIDIAGVQQDEYSRFSKTIDGVKQALSKNQSPPQVSDYYMLGYARSGFLNSQGDGLCLVITQAISPEMQKLLDGQ